MESLAIQPIEGAAKYTVEFAVMGCCVVMWPSDGGSPSVIDRKKSYESALKCAANWQKKENAAVRKEAIKKAKIK